MSSHAVVYIKIALVQKSSIFNKKTLTKMLSLLTAGGQPIATRTFQRSVYGALSRSVMATYRPVLARPLANQATSSGVLATLTASNPAHQRDLETSKRSRNDIHLALRLPVVKRSLHTSRISRNTPQADTSPIPPTRPSISHRRLRRLRNLLILLSLLSILYCTYPPFRHTTIAVVRCARVMKAVSIDVWDYKQVFAAEERLGAAGRELTNEEIKLKRRARRACHRRSAERLLEALKKNSGIYVKLGQHVAAVQVLPKEWTETMRPLQDQCFPTPVERTDEMLREDLGMGIDDMFTDFEPNPIGVASLAQVHRAVDKRTGRRVAVKVQHADLQEFAAVDMATVNFAIHFVKYIFPDFEFSWLGEEMNVMLPLEMDFRHEAANSARCMGDFLRLKGKTSLYLPEVFWAEKRCMVMEFIEGGRVDDLMYLKKHKIDRNQVSQELARIFSQMVYINGYFHADPHHGNLLIRPKAPGSTSPFNFDVCLLDHGQYFDVPDDLRVNYAHFWLSLIKSTSKKTIAERRHYARLVGNIDDDMVCLMNGRYWIPLSRFAVPDTGIRYYRPN